MIFFLFIVADIQRRWKSLRDCFRRELLRIKKMKSGSGQECRRKEYIYFKQLSFLTPICETKSQEEQTSEGPAEEKNEPESQLPDRLVHPKKKKRKTAGSEEQVLLQTLAKNIKKKTNAQDDPDKHFLLGILPHFKSLPENAKLEVKAEFINILKRYKQYPTLVNQPFPTPATHFFTGPSSSVSQAPHYFSFNSQPSESLGTQFQPTRTDSVSPESDAASQAMSSLSDSSSICNEYFTQ